jgi:hypothetical protein
MGLDELVAKLERLATKGYDDAKAEAERAVQSIVDAQYQAGIGPSGEPWADKVDGTASFLRKSGEMARESKAIRGVSGIDVKIPSPGGFHQSGTKKMQARPLVPDEGTLPTSWEQPIEEAVTRVLSKAIGS